MWLDISAPHIACKSWLKGMIFFNIPLLQWRLGKRCLLFNTFLCFCFWGLLLNYPFLLLNSFSLLQRNILIKVAAYLRRILIFYNSSSCSSWVLGSSQTHQALLRASCSMRSCRGNPLIPFRARGLWVKSPVARVSLKLFQLVKVNFEKQAAVLIFFLVSPMRRLVIPKEEISWRLGAALVRKTRIRKGFI